jgi:UDP-glucose 4-epimerase
MDLAAGHIKALERIDDIDDVLTVNLGTGEGYSVLDMVKAFEKASGKTIPYVIDPRRPGDIAVCYADPTFAEKTLGWKATRGIEEMCRDAWRWQSQNPDGYR